MPRNITLKQAEAVVEACKAEAVAIGQPMNIAVVDDGANLVAFAAMDDTKLIGADISQRKALTAVYFQMDTKDLVPLVQPGAALYGIEATTGGRLVVFGGGVLLRRPDGTIAGGVGVSAGTVDEDHRVADAGRKAFETERAGRVGEPA
ncbi:heme-binding protein [Couchioplanes caeruleus]|uniref:GlcG/HbpS family heme-binding protein n=1 Tax=Couchioplanes caeruleus TaxID=56438 RepID=UPI0020C03FAA|nr:heme-binding protein [Couchioplanes caeruleus]UQU62654.1 heme-binding protein [Couchioplanes caeruleus]